MKRILSSMLLMAFIFAFSADTAFAINFKPSTLTVIMMCADKTLEGIDVAIYRVADAGENNGSVAYTPAPEFVPAEADFTNLGNEKNILLAKKLLSFAHTNNIEEISQMTDTSGRATFSNLSAGIYLVSQSNRESSEYVIEPYLVFVPNPNEKGDGWEYNVVAYPKTEPTKKDSEITSVSVYKIWAGTKKIPKDILVQLYCGDIAYGNTVHLNADNSWSYTWTDLNSNEVWKVDELNVPSGFVKTVSGDSTTGFIITNTKTSTPAKSPTPTVSPVPTASPGDAPSAPPPGTKNPPKTGDESNLQLIIALFIFSFAALSIYVIKSFISRKKQ